jgi:hypothetical protein
MTKTGQGFVLTETAGSCLRRDYSTSASSGRHKSYCAEDRLVQDHFSIDVDCNIKGAGRIAAAFRPVSEERVLLLKVNQLDTVR